MSHTTPTSCTLEADDSIRWEKCVGPRLRHQLWLCPFVNTIHFITAEFVRDGFNNNKHQILSDRLDAAETVLSVRNHERVAPRGTNERECPGPRNSGIANK